MQRAFAAASFALALGCAPPWIPDGLTCDDGAGCPTGWSCVHSTSTGHDECVRPHDARSPLDDAGVAVSCEACAPGLECDTIAGLCTHPCVVAPSDCPVDTGCVVESGCVGPAFVPCDPECPEAQRCVSGLCTPACAPGGCDLSTDCVDGVCRPLLRGAEAHQDIADASPFGCFAGVNPDFADHSLTRWCSIWRTSAPIVPEPQVTGSSDAELRIVIMGRFPSPSGPGLDDLAAFSLFQVHTLATPEDFDRTVDWDFTAIGGGSTWGAALSLVFFGGPEPVAYVRSWSDGAYVPRDMFSSTMADPTEEGRSWLPRERPPPLSIRDAANAVVPEGSPETVLGSVAIVMSVWTLEPRVELRHFGLHVTPTAP